MREGFVHRRCERSEANPNPAHDSGLLRCARKDGGESVAHSMTPDAAIALPVIAAISSSCGGLSGICVP
ncbi:hypothetical protein, partial [Bradyrhizobium sp.]|uniref:hypothetical protein n=1 Tax=Bradyrhizobium sp. TaxID=376 RepID=UPI002907FB5E